MNPNTDLQTKRLILIPFSQKDDQLLWRLFTHPYIRKYVWDDDLIPLDQVKGILNQNECFFNEKRWGLWRIKGKEEDIGFVGLWPFFDEIQPQLIYGILPAYTGQGFATEAAARIREYAFTQLGFSHLRASCDVPNTASQAVAIRLGMKLIKKEYPAGKPTLFYQIGAEAFIKAEAREA